MTAGIFLVDAQGELTEMRETPFAAEAHFQELLARYPSLLAGDQIDPQIPRRWLLIDREVGIEDSEGGAERWSVDHLFVDQDGVPTLVEVKRATDSRLRREVVGQMLDYAANASVFWRVEAVQARLEQRCRSTGIEPQEVLTQAFGPEVAPEGFWKQLEANLRYGRLRLLFVADEVPPEIRRVVEFLNAKMADVEVLAVELKHFAGGEIKTLVPRVYGHSNNAEAAKSAGPSRSWDEASFFAAIRSKCGHETSRVAEEILRWAREQVATIAWGKGKIHGAFSPELTHRDLKCRPFAIWTFGRAEIWFGNLTTVPPFDEEAVREELRRRLNAIEGVAIPERGNSRFPSIYLETLQRRESLLAFFAAFEWVFSEIRKT